ncbi:mitochondrial 37S ribosomal protein bS21m [Kwoniella pini CBS 10737]|uniref:Ribosomal protein S21 n=1 Tax=Kwoniella pini CBS 10737 TaxID=1296096 RepID=A0A1B9I4S0_9TREE|nr:ribosomal protein S21 [Kwoniella pini CBS 10737]OCF50516.1 ribosomal protein S21 [Kwoniella pini CBS 10737]
MSFLIRSTLRNISNSSSSSSRITIPLIDSIRFNSTLPSSSSSNEITTNTPLPPSPPPKSGELFSKPSSKTITNDSFSKLRFDNLSENNNNNNDETIDDSEIWWKKLSINSNSYNFGFPTNISTGRSITVPKGGEFNSSYKRLQGLLRQSNLKKELRLQEFHEKPSVKRRRLISERHRRRFKEMVRTKVQQVVSMRNRR